MADGPRLARVLRIESRLWAALVGLLTRRHDGDAAHAHSYRRNLQLLLVVMLCLTALEGGITELVLALLLPGTPWPWLALAPHLYALAWIGGLVASLRTRPHLLADGRLLLRDSVFTEITIPVSAITGARRVQRAGQLRSGWQVDRSANTATLAHGETSIALDLDPEQPVDVDDGTPVTGLSTVYFMMDDPDRFLRALAADS